MKKTGLLLLGMILLGSVTFAGQRNTVLTRPLTEKIGVGFSIPFANLPVLAGRYWLTDIAAVECFLGFRIDDNHNSNNIYTFGGKFLYVLKSYKNLNLFSAASLALCSEGTTYSVIRTGLGIEWFVLDDLSLSTQADLSLRVGGGQTSLETSVESIPRIGIRYYL
ncbi:MAG: hypothetical protein LBD61_05240 [Endomicrobium sp.]|jgi:hypothetical protein|nr:hypothetical protein [Endomicrobium sp.]